MCQCNEFVKCELVRGKIKKLANVRHVNCFDKIVCTKSEMSTARVDSRVGLGRSKILEIYFCSYAGKIYGLIVIQASMLTHSCNVQLATFSFIVRYAMELVLCVFIAFSYVLIFLSSCSIFVSSVSSVWASLPEIKQWNGMELIIITAFV